MYKKILVPLDGSKRAEAILPHVENLAVRYGAEVVLFSIEEPPLLLEHDEVVDLESYWQTRESQRKQTETYLQGIVQKWRAKDIKAEIHIGQGPVVKGIIDFADQEKVDLVAMASHGRSGLARTFYGSVAAGVLQHIDRPLLLIRSRHSDSS